MRSEAATKIDRKTKGVPIEFYEWERIFVDEIHESLCTTKGELEESKEEKTNMGVEEFTARNRGAARELLGIAQHDPAKRPLRARGAIYGLTGTPLLDSESRVIELANMAGGTYLTSMRSHWRRHERESGRDNFLQLWLEPTRSRMYRRERNLQCCEWMKKGMQRDKAADLDVNLEIRHYRKQMSAECGKRFVDATPSAIKKTAYSTMPPDYDENQGQDPMGMLKANATLKTRQNALLEIVHEIAEADPTTKVIVFADHSFGGYKSAKEALGGSAANLDGLDNEAKNKVLSFYKDVDATEADKNRPRVLLLTFSECAGLNLQMACNNVILYQPLYSWTGHGGGDPKVEDCSTELQAVGRVYRTGQIKDVVVHKIILAPPAEAAADTCVDDWALKRNESDEARQAATNAA